MRKAVSVEKWEQKPDSSGGSSECRKLVWKGEKPGRVKAGGMLA